MMNDKEAQEQVEQIAHATTEFLFKAVDNSAKSLSRKPTLDELEIILSDLPIAITYAALEAEKVGILADIAEMKCSAELLAGMAESGAKTVTQQKEIARVSRAEAVLNAAIHDRAYKALKEEIDGAREIINAAKRMYDARIKGGL